MEGLMAMYFGTTSRGSGHNMTMLNGSVDNNMLYKFERELDGDEYLYKVMCNGNGLRLIRYRGFSMLCAPWSVHDDRGGSKTIFLIPEKNISVDDIFKELDKYEWVKKLFDQLSDKYHLDGVHEIKIYK